MCLLYQNCQHIHWQIVDIVGVSKVFADAFHERKLLNRHLFTSRTRIIFLDVKPIPRNRPILSLNRKPKSRVESALNPIDLTVLAEYHEQIESNLQRIERKNQRTWYSKPRSEMGVTCVGRQKMKLGSKPLI